MQELLRFLLQHASNFSRDGNYVAAASTRFENLKLDSIVRVSGNQYRHTTITGINEVIASIQKFRLRKNLLTILVKEHSDGCQCSVCSSYGKGYDLYDGFHRMEAIKELQKTNPLLLDNLRDNEGRISIPAEIMVR